MLNSRNTNQTMQEYTFQYKSILHIMTIPNRIPHIYIIALNGVTINSGSITAILTSEASLVYEVYTTLLLHFS